MSAISRLTCRSHISFQGLNETDTAHWCLSSISLSGLALSSSRSSSTTRRDDREYHSIISAVASRPSSSTNPFWGCLQFSIALKQYQNFPSPTTALPCLDTKVGLRPDSRSLTYRSEDSVGQSGAWTSLFHPANGVRIIWRQYIQRAPPPLPYNCLSEDDDDSIYEAPWEE